MTALAKDLATRINAEHRAADAAAKSALHHALAAGDLMIEARAALKHGGWIKWIEEHFEGSVRSAQVYIKLAKNRELVEANAQRVAHLPIRQAVKALVKHDPPPRPAPAPAILADRSDELETEIEEEGGEEYVSPGEAERLETLERAEAELGRELSPDEAWGLLRGGEAPLIQVAPGAVAKLQAVACASAEPLEEAGAAPAAAASGLLYQRGEWVRFIQQAEGKLDTVKGVAGIIVRLVEEDGWRAFLIPATSEVVEHETFEAFVCSPPLEGLGMADVDVLRDLCLGHPEALAAIDLVTGGGVKVEKKLSADSRKRLEHAGPCLQRLLADFDRVEARGVPGLGDAARRLIDPAALGRLVRGVLKAAPGGGA